MAQNSFCKLFIYPISCLIFSNTTVTSFQDYNPLSDVYELEARASKILFVDRVFYDYTGTDFLGITAWYVGKYEIGQKAVLKAFEYTLESAHLKFNVS